MSEPRSANLKSATHLRCDYETSVGDVLTSVLTHRSSARKPESAARNNLCPPFQLDKACGTLRRRAHRSPDSSFPPPSDRPLARPPDCKERSSSRFSTWRSPLPASTPPTVPGTPRASSSSSRCLTAWLFPSMCAKLRGSKRCGREGEQHAERSALSAYVGFFAAKASDQNRLPANIMSRVPWKISVGPCARHRHAEPTSSTNTPRFLAEYFEICIVALSRFMPVPSHLLQLPG